MVKDKPSGPKNKYAKSLKFNFSSFTEKPIVKNGYVVALLVFIGLVVAFNLASSYDNSVGNQVTGLASSSSSSLGNSFSMITDLLSSLTNFVFSGLLGKTILPLFTTYNDTIMRLLIFVILFTVVSMIGMPKTITAIVSLVIAVFIPSNVITSIFGQNALFGGILGLIIWAAVILLPLYGLFKGLKHAQERFIKFALGVLFLCWLAVIGFVNEYNVPDVSSFRGVWDLLISFAILACFVGFILGIWKGFTTRRTSTGGGGKKSLEEIGRGVGRFAGIDVGEPFKKFGSGVKAGYGGKKFFGFGGGSVPATGDQREALVKLERLANMYYKKAIKNSSVQQRNALEEKFTQQASKLGISKKQAMRILWK